MKHIPLYTNSRESAKQRRELTYWVESYHANLACSQAIEAEIADSFDGHSLDNGAVQRVIGNYSFDRVNWVLQTTIQQDAAAHPDHQEWSQGAYTHHLRDEMQDYKVCAEPAALDAFTAQARQAWQELGLYDHTHCLTDDSKQDYHSKVLVLRPTSLADEYKNPLDQLFYCSGGFGARPEASGRKIYGHFLHDDELCQFDRQDFIGVLKDEHLPDWAREKAERIQRPNPLVMSEEPSL